MPSKMRRRSPWSIRMPDKLLRRLERDAAIYALPVRTYMKLMIEIGLEDVASKGYVQVYGSQNEVDAAIKYNRDEYRKAKKQKPSRKSAEEDIPRATHFPDVKSSIEPSQVERPNENGRPLSLLEDAGV